MPKSGDTLRAISLKFSNFGAIIHWPSPGSSSTRWFELKAARVTVTLDRKSSQLSQINLAVHAGIWPDMPVSLQAEGPTLASNAAQELAQPTPLIRLALNHDARTTGSGSWLLQHYEVAPIPGQRFNSVTFAADPSTGTEKWDLIVDLYVVDLEYTTAEVAWMISAQGGAPQRR